MDREAAFIRSEMSQTRRDLDYKLERLQERARELSPRRVVQRNMPDYLLERVIAAHNVAALFIKVARLSTRLRSHPRFQKLLATVRFP